MEYVCVGTATNSTTLHPFSKEAEKVQENHTYVKIPVLIKFAFLFNVILPPRGLTKVPIT